MLTVPSIPSCVQVLLLDEITVDLDVLGRKDLMRFLVDECETRGATIIYATHIFDGLEFWPTHIALVARGSLQSLTPAEEIPALKQVGGLSTWSYSVFVNSWFFSIMHQYVVACHCTDVY